MSVIVESSTETAELAQILLDAPDWAVFCGNLAPVVNVCLRLSPIPTVYRFYTKGTVGSMPLMPYTALLSDSILWLFFGLLTLDTRIIVTHTCGSSIAVCYAIAYARTYSRTGKASDLTILPGTLKQHGCFVLLVTSFSFIVTVFVPRPHSDNIIGFGADMGSLFMYAGPLSAVRAVLREKDSSSLPLPYTTACLLNGFTWAVYGWFVVKEVVLWAPSLVGLVLASIQLFLIVSYRKGSGRDGGSAFELVGRPQSVVKKGSDIDSDEELIVADLEAVEKDDDLMTYGDDDEYEEDVGDDGEFDSFLEDRSEYD